MTTLQTAGEAQTKCDGSCDEHTGTVKRVSVAGWSVYHYCDEAIKEDERRGLVVTVLQEGEEE